MKAILILAVFVVLLATGCGSGYGGGNNTKPGGTTTNSSPGY
jgi:hypothetical protein